MTLKYDIITFDCYGTLVDWEGGISGAFGDRAAAAGVEVAPSAVIAAYMKREPEVEAERFRSYREVLAETALRVAHDIGLPLSRDEARFLADSLPAWPVFIDTTPALRKLKEMGLSLGVLSNVDRDLFEGTRARLGIELDLLVTAEDIGSYKPEHGHFLEAKKRIGERRWLHAAQSYFHDITPARSLGIPTAWVNRKAEPSPDGGVPTIEVHSLTELVDRLSK